MLLFFPQLESSDIVASRSPLRCVVRWRMSLPAEVSQFVSDIFLERVRRETNRVSVSAAHAAALSIVCGSEIKLQLPSPFEGISHDFHLFAS